MSQKNKIIVPIAGMHCRSCEMLVEDKLSEIPEVEQSIVSYKKGTAEIHYTKQKPNTDEIEEAIRSAGYAIGVSSVKKPFFSRNASDYKDLGISLLFLLGIYIALKTLGINNIKIGGGSSPTSLPVVFLVGITAGLSTCMALVGGLILGMSARHSEKHPEATPLQKFRPHLIFNLGRVLSYAVLGGVLGSAGAIFRFSGTTLGVMTILVGAAMLMLGFKLVGIFPRLDQAGLTLPKGISRILGIKPAKGGHEKEYSHRGSFAMGALTFFLPCGFTQVMQLYAVSTGSFLRGALIMGVFALGTVPGLLGIGGLTSVVRGIFAKRFFKFAGVVVIFLSFVNISNGYTLMGWQWGSALSAEQDSPSETLDANVTVENGVQIVRMNEVSRGYSPNKFTIKKDMPVRWIINATDPFSCAASIMIPSLDIRKNLRSGENIIEFTPRDAGRLVFSCGMGMYVGVFNVKDTPGLDGSTAEKASPPVDSSPANSVQVIKAVFTYSETTNEDITPNVFRVKAGMPVRFEVDARDDGQGCMSTIMVPGLYNTPQILDKGSKIVMEFTPRKPGSYNITCAMGLPRGVITVTR
ncbi:MAG: sulfite exporter TauE/SafE family protein [Patescibacteria group bacterium]